MVRAVVLVKSPRTLVAEKVKKLTGVRDAFDTAGRFDCIVLAELPKLTDIKSGYADSEDRGRQTNRESGSARIVHDNWPNRSITLLAELPRQMLLRLEQRVMPVCQRPRLPDVPAIGLGIGFAPPNGMILDDVPTFACTFPSVPLWRGSARQQA